MIEPRAGALILKGVRYYFNIIDPTILCIVEQESSELGLSEKLKAGKKWVNYLIIKGRAFLFCEKEKKALSIGREATPIISSLLTGSDDIQIDSIM